MSRLQIKVGTNTFAIAGITIIAAAVSLYVVSRRKQSQGRLLDNSSTSSTDLERQFQTAVETAKTMSNSMTNGDQLMLYGLYKQALHGNCTMDKVSTYHTFLSLFDKYIYITILCVCVCFKPGTLQVVARAKYNAWGKFQNMSQTVAMKKYCEVIHHFSTGGKSIFAPNDDNDDIVYPDDNEEEEEEEMSGFGMTQSTMMGSNIQQTDNSTNTNSIHECAKEGNVSQLQLLVRDKGMDVNTLDESGQTALHFAADRGHFNCVSSLLQLGANVNASDVDGITVLQSAVIGGYVEIARILLQAGANPDQTDSDGDTPRNCIEPNDEPMIQLFQQYIPTKQNDF